MRSDRNFHFAFRLRTNIPHVPLLAMFLHPLPSQSPRRDRLGNPRKDGTLTVFLGGLAERISEKKPSFHHFLLLCTFARVPAGAFFFNLI